jgi:hypothetical protein
VIANLPDAADVENDLFADNSVAQDYLNARWQPLLRRARTWRESEFPGDGFRG